MGEHRARIAFFVIFLGISIGALGQGLPSAVLSGRVTGEGQGLPGVLVTASSPALQGVRSVAATATGDYLFPNLPPGEYAVTFAMDGFTPQTKPVKLSAAQVLFLDVTLSLAPVAAAVIIVDRTKTISQTSTASTTYTSELLARLPTGRALASAVALTPGLNTNGAYGATIAGAQSTENVYQVNGVYIGDEITRTPRSLFIEDAILETTTMTSSLSAEYGRFTGGVVNTLTKTGGNRFSGSLRASLSNDSWRATSAYRNPATGSNPQEGAFVQKVIPTWEATLGGPILRDALWFFAGGRFLDTTDANTMLTRYTNIPVAFGTKETRYEAKLTATPVRSHSLTGSWIGIERTQANYSFPSPPPADLTQFYDRQTPESLLAVSYNGTLTSSFFAEAFYSKKTITYQNSGGRYPDPVLGTPVADLIRGAVMNAPFFSAVATTETRGNDDWFLKLTAFLSSPAAGSHTVVAGYDDFGTQRRSNNYQSASNFILNTVNPSIVQGTSIYPVIGAGAWLEYWPIFVEAKETDLRTRSAFLNDAWRPSNRLSFNLGIRYDRNHATDAGGNVTSDDSAWSPRLAGTLDVKGDGSLRVSASYAQYVAALHELQAGSGATLAGTPANFYWYYGDMPGYRPINTGPTGPYLSSQDALRQLFAAFGAAGCLPDPLAPACKAPQGGPPYISGVNVQIHGSLASPSAREYVLGMSGFLGRKGTFRADVVRREYRDFYDLRKDTSTGKVVSPVDPGQKYDLGLIVNSSDYAREYTGLHAQLVTRAADRLSLGAAWTWSHLIGDFGDGGGRGALHAYPEYFDRKWSAPVGDLGTDTRHRVRLFGTWDVPTPSRVGSLTLGLVQAWDTGTPFEAVGNVRTAPWVSNPGYLTPPAGVAYFFTARGAYRREDVFGTDLSLTWSYRLGGSVELWISPQLFNVFNAQHAVAVNTSVSTSTNSSSLAPFNPFTTATPVECPQGQAAAQCKALGANWQKGADFGKPTGPAAYQAARTFAVAAGVRF